MIEKMIKGYIGFVVILLFIHIINHCINVGDIRPLIVSVVVVGILSKLGIKVYNMLKNPPAYDFKERDEALIASQEKLRKENDILYREELLIFKKYSLDTIDNFMKTIDSKRINSAYYCHNDVENHIDNNYAIEINDYYHKLMKKIKKEYKKINKKYKIRTDICKDIEVEFLREVDLRVENFYRENKFADSYRLKDTRQRITTITTTSSWFVFWW